MINTKIEIPEEFKVIAIRVNSFTLTAEGGNTGSWGGYEWPSFGKAQTVEKRGLYGVKLSQNLNQIEIHSTPYGVYQKYLILEVDTRKIKETGISEIIFSECNVLFSGQLPEFMNELKNYATAEEYSKISALLDNKKLLILGIRESPEKAAEHARKMEDIKIRTQIEDALQKGRDQLRKLQQDRINQY